MKDASSGSAGGEKDFVSFERETRIAGGECAFSRQSVGHVVGRKRCPVFAVPRFEQKKLAVDGITEGKALFFGNTSDGVEKELLAIVRVLQFPGFAAVGGFVDAGFFAFAAGHDVSSLLAEGNDAAKVERSAALDMEARPRFTLIMGLHDHALRTRRPHHPHQGSTWIKHGAYATQVRIDPAGLHFPPMHLRATITGKQEQDSDGERSLG